MIVQFGGQTPLNLALPLKRRRRAHHRHRSPRIIDLAEDRKLFGKLLDELEIPQPAERHRHQRGRSLRGRATASAIPVLVRPSYVLGGRAMVIAYDEEMRRASTCARPSTFSQERPVLVDHFLEDATEVDVDALCDGEDVLIAGIMEHIEEAGVHSGDSVPACCRRSRYPEATLQTIRDYTVRLASALQRHRPDERAVRDPARHGVRARSESARLAHRALRQQSDRRAAAEDRRAA